ncbi:uncharacterized protein topaz1 isoform X2 [Entelurus aequoreus]|uniref:uncharacterized protein topaz1 isoform X2 n=1 Tax=Entelurus aequoreus TaxID=161455 RepID=UPI002B1DCB7F|nr:uncharacterized protein topaz1 isoform X2 [Entelurus aequoreus]
MMLPSSNRVKLNRTRLKDVACLKAARRPEGRQPPGDLNRQTHASHSVDDDNVSHSVHLNRQLHASHSVHVNPSLHGSLSVDADTNNGGHLSCGSVERRGLRDVDRTVNPISTSLAGSEVSLKRRSHASTCTICGDSKYISLQRRTQVKLVAKSFDLCPEKTSREDFRLGRHPKVTLCDVVQNSMVRRDCSSFLLPDVLRTETVYCFKHDMRVARFQSSPRCDERQNTTVTCLRMQLSENRRQPGENTKNESGINSTASRFLEGRDSDVSKTSFWIGKADQSSGGNVGTKRQDLDNLLKELQTRSQSCPEPTLRKDNSVPEEPCPKKVAQETPELFSDDQATFTCQRVRVHIRREHYSCARTDMPWPFADNGPAILKLPADRQRLSPQHHQPLGSLGTQSSDIHHESDLTEGVGHKSSHETENDLHHAKELTVGLPAVTTTSFTASQQSDSGTDLPSVALSSSSIASTHSPSELCLRGLLTDRPVLALSPIPKAVWSPTSSPSASISQGSHQSSLLLWQEIGTNGRSTPSNYESPPAIDKLDEECMENTRSELLLPPVLSPFNSPETNFSRQNISLDKDGMNTLLPRVFINGLLNLGKCNRLEVVSSDLGSLPDRLPRESQASPCSVGDVDNRTRVEANEARGTPEKPPSDQTPDRDHSTTELPSSLSTLNGDGGGEPNKEQPPSSGAAWPCVLNEFTAYQHDILLVDVNHDESELFEDLPQKSLLKLGPVRVQVNQMTSRAPQTMKPRSTPVNIKFSCGSPDINEESISRPWRPQKGNNTCPKSQKDTSFVTDRQTRPMGKYEAYKNRINGGQERQHPIQNQSHNPIPHLCTWKNGPWRPNSANKRDLGCKKPASYCRLFFSESESCGFKMCRFLHVPQEGDEKLCVDTVTRFSRNPTCVHKAGAVFTGYYQNNAPGRFFSMPVFLSLLWALLKAGLVSDVLSVLSVSLAHNIAPTHEFLRALFNVVREKSLSSFVAQLTQLSYKMACAKLLLSLDCFDSVKNYPEFQQIMFPTTSTNHWLCASSSSVPILDYMTLSYIVEIELSTKLEDWRQMAEVFCSICASCQDGSQLERISSHISVALLWESKDKMSLPFAAFAETICQKESPTSVLMSLFGRIGVSLMLRYYKRKQWAKGRRVVEVLSLSKVSYSMLKDLFGNEDGGSRCSLITMATELFLLSGSLEGALNTLRENKWFLSSSLWPCPPAHLESRSRVLIHLAERSSHRDTLEVLSNLPGIQEPSDQVEVFRYTALFNSHLQVCVDRHVLPVASDTVDFMLCKKLLVDYVVLQRLIQKLAKQNHWLRARQVFKHSLTAGYYPAISADPGLMALMVPSQLVEEELALAFEMFITVNAYAVLPLSETTPSTLSITLKRTQESESDYLLAGSRLLAAACIPQPKLLLRYTAVNSSQEQVFTLSLASAQRWLHSNHVWANQVWT